MDGSIRASAPATRADAPAAAPGPIRVVAAEARLVATDFAVPYKLSRAYGTVARTEAVVLRLVDADGFVGWGEANPKVPFTEESPATVMAMLRDHLLPLALGAEDAAPARWDRTADAAVSGNLCAKGAVAMALLDIAGKRAGVPAAWLLGGTVRRSIPVLWPLGSGSAEDDAAVIDVRRAQGFATFMAKMGERPVREDVARVHALEKRYGDAIAVIADANQGWSRQEALAFVDGIAGTRVLFLEQPVAKHDIDGLRAVRARARLPISADEAVVSEADALALLRADACDVFSLKASKNGGPLRTRRLATLAEAFGLACYMNSMLEFGITQAASLQLGCTIGNLVEAGHAYMSTLRLKEDPTDFGACVRQGVAHLPAAPGLGVAVDEAHLARMTSAQFALKAGDR